METVDEAIALLTGLPAGVPDAEGVYPPESVNGKVLAALETMHERWQALRANDEKDGHND